MHAAAWQISRLELVGSTKDALSWTIQIAEPSKDRCGRPGRMESAMKVRRAAWRASESLQMPPRSWPHCHTGHESFEIIRNCLAAMAQYISLTIGGLDGFVPFGRPFRERRWEFVLLDFHATCSAYVG